MYHRRTFCYKLVLGIELFRGWVYVRRIDIQKSGLFAGLRYFEGPVGGIVDLRVNFNLDLTEFFSVSGVSSSINIRPNFTNRVPCRIKCTLLHCPIEPFIVRL